MSLQFSNLDYQRWSIMLSWMKEGTKIYMGLKLWDIVWHHLQKLLCWTSSFSGCPHTKKQTNYHSRAQLLLVYFFRNETNLERCKGKKDILDFKKSRQTQHMHTFVITVNIQKVLEFHALSVNIICQKIQAVHLNLSS